MLTIPFKRGDTFVMNATVTIDSLVQDLTNWEVTCSIRRVNGDLVDDAAITYIDRALGTYAIQVADTKAWPTETLLADIQYVTQTGQILSTESFEISCVSDVTIDP